MSRKEEFYILSGLLIAVLGCAAAWLALPQLQPWLAAQLQNPLFLPLVAVAVLALALLGALLFAYRDRLLALLRALRPQGSLERRYLDAVAQTYGKTPALLAGRDTYSDLSLLEAFSPLSLRPDREGATQGPPALPDDEAALAALAADLPDWRSAAPRRPRNAAPRRPRSRTEQLAYWTSWALAQALLLGLAAALTWLLLTPPGGWDPRLWWVGLALLVGGAWLVAAVRLHGWLAGDNGALSDLLARWRSRRTCMARPGTPGREIWEHRRLLIMGDPGSGKTTLLRHLAVVCARQRLGRLRRSDAAAVRALYGWPECPFPLYIPLRALDQRIRSAGLLGAYGQQLGLLLQADLDGCTAPFFAERLARGGCLVLLDAFDELRDEAARTNAARLIAGLPPGPPRRPNRFVVTSRIVGYEGQLNGEHFVRRRVQPLDEDQAALFIHARYTAIAASERRALAVERLTWSDKQQADNLIRRLPNNPGLRRLSRNPLLLSLMVALHHDHHGRGLQLPEERYRLYEEAVRLLVRDWERRKDADVNLEPTDDRSDLNLDERLRLLRELAWTMFEQSAGGGDAQAHSTIRGRLLTARLAELLALLPAFAPEKSGEARSQHAASEAERWRQNIGQRGGVLHELGNLPGGNDVAIQFAHLTFQEYLAARAAASEDTERRLGRILHCWDRPAWREVLLLYASSHDATPVVRHLLQQGDTGALLAGAVLLERPYRLDPDLQEQTIVRLRALAFESAEASEEQAQEALAQIEERAALPERAALLRAFQHAPHGPVRARALELALERELIAPPQRQRPTFPAPPFGSPSRSLSLPATKPAAPAAPAVPPELVPALLRACQHDPHCRPRLAAGYALAGADPRFGDGRWVPELVHVPAGPFLIGSVDTDKAADEDEKPQHRLELPDFWIGRYPVTVGQWRRFAGSDGYTNRAYWTEAGWRSIHASAQRPAQARPWYTRLLPARRTLQTSQPFLWRDPGEDASNLPVVGVSWFEAVAYCRWLSAQTGHPFRLPSEAEWEKAARGPGGRIWPWGDTWQPEQCNSAELGLGQPSPVGSFPGGASPCGALDMAGNVWEWCATQHNQRYPYEQAEEWAETYLEADVPRRLRGGSFAGNQKSVRGAYRFYIIPRLRVTNRGLRVASHSPRPDAEF